MSGVFFFFRGTEKLTVSVVVFSSGNCKTVGFFRFLFFAVCLFLVFFFLSLFLSIGLVMLLRSRSSLMLSCSRRAIGKNQDHMRLRRAIHPTPRCDHQTAVTPHSAPLPPLIFFFFFTNSGWGVVGWGGGGGEACKVTRQSISMDPVYLR